MIGEDATRRNMLRALALLPAGGLLLRPSGSAAAANKIIVFDIATRFEGPGIDLRVFGWAAQTPDGWTGQTVDAGISIATRDFAGTAAGTTRIVPKGMSNTINGWTDKDGVRASSVCFEEVTDGSVEGPIVKLKGKITSAENPIIFRIGDPMTFEGNADTGEATYMLHGGGKDNVFKMKGMILVS